MTTPTPPLEPNNEGAHQRPGLSTETYKHMLILAADTIDMQAKRIDGLMTAIEELEGVIEELRARLEDSESAVCAFINAVPDAIQSDPRLN